MAAKNTTFKPWGKEKHKLEQQAMAESDEHYISKTQAKREVEALQKLGLKLVELSKNSLLTFDLDERLFDAILLAKNIHSHSGHRRQTQLIGKLMRHVDADDIRLKLERFHTPAVEANEHFHKLETWRDRILTEGDPVINELVSQYPDFERSRLRQLLRNAKKETELNKPPKSSRQLFKYIKEIIPESELET
jgi:ribosome-associated protein